VQLHFAVAEDSAVAGDFGAVDSAGAEAAVVGVDRT
jgi:hypothetical protein